MFPAKIRNTIIASAAVAAVLSVPGVASAMTSVRVASVTQTRVVAPKTTIAAREVGSAGVPGYSDEKCESLEKDWETAMNFSLDSANAGDAAAADNYHEQAKSIERQLTDSCLVVD